MKKHIGSGYQCKVSGGALIAAGLLGLFFHTFPGILLLAAIVSIVIGILYLP